MITEAMPEKLFQEFIKKGDEVTILPQNIQTKISKIETGGKEVESVFTNQPAVLHIRR